jgi:hypothetical protein
VNLAVEGENQPDGVFRHRVGRIGRHARDGQPQASRGGNIDVVVPGATHGDQPRAAGSQMLQHVRVQLVIYKGADGLEAASQRRRFKRQPRLEEGQFVPGFVRRPAEKLAVKPLRTKYRSSHKDPLEAENGLCQ